MADTPRRKKKTKNPNAPPKAAADLRAILDQFDVHNSSVGVVHGDQRFTYLANSDADALSYANYVNQHSSQYSTPASAAPQDEFFAQDHEQQQVPAQQYTPDAPQVAMYYPQYTPQPMDVKQDTNVMPHDVPDPPLQEVPQAASTGNYGYVANPFLPNPPAYPAAYPQEVSEQPQMDFVPRKDGDSTFVGLNANGAAEGGANLYGPMPSKDEMDSRWSLIGSVVVVLILILGFFAWIIVPSIFIARRDNVQNEWVASRCSVVEQDCEWRSTDALGSPCLGESWGEKTSGEGWILTPNCRWVDPELFTIKDGVVTDNRARASLSSNQIGPASESRRNKRQSAEVGALAGPQRVELRYTACHTQYKISMEMLHPRTGERVKVEETCRDNHVSVKPIFNTDSDFCQQFREGLRCDAAAVDSGDPRCMPSELSKVRRSVQCWIDPSDSSKVTVEGRKSVQAETWALGALVVVWMLMCICGGGFYAYMRAKR